MSTGSGAVAGALAVLLASAFPGCRDEAGTPARSVGASPRGAASSGKASPAQLEHDAPRIVGGHGSRVPYGYWTTFTGPYGRVRLPYTQIYGAEVPLKGERLRIRGLLRRLRPGDWRHLPRFGAGLSLRDEAPVYRYQDLVGRVFRNFKVGLTWIYVRLNPNVRGFVRVGELRFTRVTPAAVEGTFRGQFHPEQGGVGKVLFEIKDGRFRAYPGALRVDRPKKHSARSPRPR